MPGKPLVALVGQPNCGKSTLFNALAGFKANTGNFPGTTVSFTQSEVLVAGRQLDLIDLPGTYSLAPHDAAEVVTRQFLFSGRPDAIIVVMDASVMSRSLELTLELIETGLPIVVALNMMDDAKRKGVEIDLAALEERLGVPVVATIATRGTGVVQVAQAALDAARDRRVGIAPVYDRDVEESLAQLVAGLPGGLSESLGANDRFLAVRLLESDELTHAAVGRAAPAVLELANGLRRHLATLHDWPEDSVFASHRHALAVDLFESVARVVRRGRTGWRESLDDYLMHPFWGLVGVVAALSLLFVVAFLVGSRLAGLIETPFALLFDWISPLAAESLPWALAKGLAEGIAGGVGIVLPYLLPLLFLMSLGEDLGYLPRAAFLIDGLLHRIGLHGKSVIPLILGYGCNVPALMATRVLETPRDRIITALLVPFTACSARTVVILALVAGLIGPLWALGIYALNILVTALVGRGLSAIVPGNAPGLLMDIPPYRIPPLASVLKKVWFRVYEFLVRAWPILVAASIVMGLLEYVGVDLWLNRLLSPLTSGLLGLPEAVGVTLFFGILRKELSLVLLYQALGTTDVLSVMTVAQVLGFTVFVTFYIPCVATLAVQVREIGWRWTAASAALNTGVATILGVSVRLLS
jgi:ferrous iron transport protein B